MARPPSESGARGKIAVLGVETPVGAHVREGLEARAIDGARVDLYGATDVEAVLSEYRGEARLIQPADRDSLRSHGVVFVCAPSTAAEAILADPAPDQLVLDLTGSREDDVAHARLRPIAPGAAGVRRVPHPIALLLLALLEPLFEEPGIDRAVAHVLRPASDVGEPGVDELRGQVSGLLNFGELPKDVFGRRLAFNCLPQSGGQERAEAIERLAERDVRTLLGPADGRIALRMIWVPVFFGHTVSLHVVPSDATRVDALAERLAGAPDVLLRASPEECTTEDGASQGRVLVARPRPDGADGVWIWAVAEDAAPGSAREALRIVEASGRLYAEAREST